METRQRLCAAEHPTVGQTTDATSLLATVRSEQTRFLDAVCRAGASLAGGSHELANASALHCQLTRQFFDAQRSIMQLRADTDAEVAGIARTAEGDAAAMVATARSQGRVATTDGALAARNHTSRLVEESMLRAERDGGVAKRQLAELLDEWWRVENDERRAVIGDAHARADVRRRVAELEAGEIVSEAHTVEHRGAVSKRSRPSPSPVLPAHLVTALDAAHPADLRLLLAALADSLEPPATGVATPEHAGSDIVADVAAPPAHLPGDLRLIETTPNDPFVQFWGRREAPVEQREPRRRWRPAQAVLPMTAAVSALAMAMALIG